MNIRLSQKAIDQVSSLIQSAGKERFAGVRIRVESGGCSGYKYHMALANAPEPNDIALEGSGFMVYVDPSSAPLLNGLELDYVSGLVESGFVFNNPNAKKTCGCGSSFGA